MSTAVHARKQAHPAADARRKELGTQGIPFNVRWIRLTRVSGQWSTTNQ